MSVYLVHNRSTDYMQIIGKSSMVGFIDYSMKICFFSLTILLLDVFLFVQPFFLPVSMHVLLAALREWRRYKQEMAKYLTWKAKVKVNS